MSAPERARPTREAGQAFVRMGEAADAAEDAVEAFAHEWLHRLDGPGGWPCSRCAALLADGGERA